MLYPDWSFYRTRARWVAVSKHARACTQTHTQREVDNHWQKKTKTKRKCQPTVLAARTEGWSSATVFLFLWLSRSLHHEECVCWNILSKTGELLGVVLLFRAHCLYHQRVLKHARHTHTQHKLSLSPFVGIAVKLRWRHGTLSEQRILFCCCLWRFILFVD